jgi:dienelactone hydrolase
MKCTPWLVGRGPPRLGAAICVLGVATSGCKSNASAPPPPVACDDDASAYDDDPGSLPATDGQVLRCGHDGSLAADEVDQLARSAGYVGAALTSGASILRLSYRTERGTDPPTAGFGGAVVLLPDHPRAAALPVIVVAHGTVGEGPACPPSVDPPTGDDTYLAELGYPLVGGGYAVILPDYAGYAAFGQAGNPPSGYHSAADEAMSVLDAARALRAVQPSLFSSDTVLVGHSQGGHAVLSALAMNATYGSGGNLVGVVAYAPSWFSMASFAALLADPNDYPLATNADTVAASVWYHYSHAELLDGPGSGALLFAADKRAQITQFFEQTCDPDEQALAAMGTLPTDLFDPTFVSDVAFAAALDLSCSGDVCNTWLARYAADRPHLTGDATRVPILVAYGDSDEWIPADREVCGFDRLAADGADATVCIVAGATHDGVVGMRAEYVNEWIGSLTLGESGPGTCGPGAQALENPEDAGGGAVTCAVPPPND